MRYTTSAAAVVAFAAVASAKDHVVEVGEDGDVFGKLSVTADKGDTVSFKIYSSHNVVQGDFSTPCKASSSGFDSGSPYSGGDSNPQYFVVTVNDTNPIYAFCSEPRHCQEGMVFAINPPSSGKTISDYQDAAKKSSGSTGGDAISGGVYSSKAGGEGSSSGSSSSSSSSSSASSSAAASKSSSAASSKSSSSASSQSSAASSSSSAASSGASTSTTSGSPTGTSAAAASSSSPGAAANVQANQGFATMAVLGLAGAMSWFL